MQDEERIEKMDPSNQDAADSAEIDINDASTATYLKNAPQIHVGLAFVVTVMANPGVFKLSLLLIVIVIVIVSPISWTNQSTRIVDIDLCTVYWNLGYHTWIHHYYYYYYYY